MLSRNYCLEKGTSLAAKLAFWAPANEKLVQMCWYKMQSLEQSALHVCCTSLCSVTPALYVEHCYPPFYPAMILQYTLILA